MVVQFDLESLGSSLQVARHLDVRARRLGIAGRVIMRDNEGGGIDDRGALQDASRG